MDYIGLGCCALAFVLYLNTLDAGFVYDDRRAILGNPDVLGTTPWRKLIHHDFWGTDLSDTGSHGSYRPLCVLSFKLNHIFGGFRPVGYHLVNVLLHCLATGLVVKVARQLLPPLWGPAVAGALFASHPIHTEAVAGIVGRADLAACNFYLLTFLAYSKHVTWREKCDQRHWVALGGAVLLAAMAMLFKETAVTALLVCAIYDVIRAFSYQDKHRIRSLSILGIALATLVQLRLSIPAPATDFSTADNPVAKSTSIWTRFLTFTYLPVFNFKLLLYPSTLSFDWGMDALPRLTTIFDARNIVSLIFYASLTKLVHTNVNKLKARLPQLLLHTIQRRTARAIKKRIQTQLTDCVCVICKQGLSLRHSSSCRAINNNNIPAPSVQCGCPPVRHPSPSPTPSTKSNASTSMASNDSITPPTSAAILLSIALLTLPFLPAANLFFYVGFVVAERILYLPSVGYCLLVGLGVGKLMDPRRGPLRSQRKRYAVMACVSVMLIACSVKTIYRNYDWRDEESLYRSAIGVNPPKVNLISLCHGFAVGWLSAAVPILKAEDTPLQSGPLTVQQTMWLGGVYPLGGVVGNGVFGILVNYYGRPTSMSLLALPNFIFWLTVLFANNFNQLVVGRFIGGFSGGLFVCVPLFVAEIANKDIRGFLGIMGPLVVTIGILLSYICGAFVQYRSVPYCFIGFPILFFAAMMFTPETPQRLIAKNQLQKAERSMIFYNNGNSFGNSNSEYDISIELDNLRKVVTQQEEDRKKSSYKLIFRKESLKGLMVGIALAAVSIFSGIIVMTMYAAQLFIDSGANFDANLSAIILGILQVCGTYASSMLVDRIGRRILLGISSLGAAVALFIFGTFSYLARQGFDLNSVDWIPVASASFYIFVNCAGVKPMPYLYVAEILPGNTRSIGLSICMMSLTLFSTTTVFTLPILVELFDLYVVMWTYGCICLLGILFSVFVMRETKGKNLNKI